MPPKKKTLKQSGMRWCMLAMSCAFLMGNYFVMDNPAILEVSIEKDLNIKPTQYAMFYSFYSYPNIILPLVGGIMLDKMGIRLGLVLFTLLVTLGQFVFMLGGYRKSFALMLTGRIIYGLELSV